MSNRQHQRMVGAISASISMCSSFAAFAMNGGEPEGQANINLAVASNFFGVPPSNSAITDLINAFEALHPSFTVAVVDNGATATLESNIINGNAAEVDLFLAADTATPQDLLVNHFELVARTIHRDARRCIPSTTPGAFSPC
jgi:ABC-type glycerol-3-phosphate transport system substrate-binding protein